MGLEIKVKDYTGTAITVRKAAADDVAGIKSLADMFRFRDGGVGELIPLSMTDVVSVVDSGGFYVAASGQGVVGCASLVIYHGVAEIRTVAVHPDYQHQGLGSKLVKACIAEAASQGHSDVFTLTQPPNFAFFKDCGFVIYEGNIPEKLQQDCYQCPRYNNGCNETALRWKNEASTGN